MTQYSHTGGGPPIPPPAPKKKSNTLLIVLAIVGAVVALCCVGVIAVVYLGGKDSPASTPEVAIGAPARDGKFEFTVHKVECGSKQAGDGLLGKTAQGQYCLVTLTVKNIGDKPQTLSDSSQKAFGPTGVQYSPDTTAGLYLNKDNSQVWFTDINPGNQVTGVIVFDVPVDASLVRLELHDSPFSGGVKVKLAAA